MMVSTKGRYALIVCLDLAQQDPEAYISLREVAQRQNISMKYLESIVAMLNRAGLVRRSLALWEKFCNLQRVVWHRCTVWSLAAPVKNRSAASPIPCGGSWIS